MKKPPIGGELSVDRIESQEHLPEGRLLGRLIHVRALVAAGHECHALLSAPELAGRMVFLFQLAGYLWRAPRRCSRIFVPMTARSQKDGEVVRKADTHNSERTIRSDYTTTIPAHHALGRDLSTAAGSLPTTPWLPAPSLRPFALPPVSMPRCPRLPGRPRGTRLE